MLNEGCACSGRKKLVQVVMELLELEAVPLMMESTTVKFPVKFAEPFIVELTTPLRD
jgi:G3E family GTPase